MTFSRLVKYALFTLLGLLVTAVAASSLAIMLVDKTRVTAIVADMVKEKTGRTLTVTGDVSAALGLYPTLKVEGVTLSNAPGAKAPQMAEIKSLEVGMSLLPLLQKQVSIRHIELKGVAFALEDVGGTPNWQFTNQPSSASAPASGFAFSADSIKAEDVTVTVRGPGYADTLYIKQATLNPGKLFSSGASFNLEGSYNKMPIVLKGKATFAGNPMTDKVGLEVSATLANDARIFLTGLASELGGKRKMDLTFTASGNNLAALNPISASLPPTQNYKIESKVRGNASALTFSDLSLTLDGHSAAGELRYAHGDGKPRITGSLNASKLVINTPEESKSGTTAETGTQAEARPFDVFRKFDADIEITIGALTFGKQSFEKLHTRAHVQSGQLRLDPFSAHMWDGSANGALTASNEGVATHIKITDVSAERAFRELDITRNFSGGSFKADADVSGRGGTKQSILSSLSGHAGFFVGKGSYKPDSALAQVATFVELLAGGSRTITVHCVVGEFDISGGVARTRTLVFDTDRALVTGRGSINLARNSIDMVFTPEAKALSLANLAVPVRVEGSLDGPRWYPDPAGAIRKVGDVALGITETGTEIIGAVLGAGKPAGGGSTKTTPSPCGGTAKPAEAPAQTAPSQTTSTPSIQPANKQQQKPSLENDIKNIKNLLKF